PSITSRQPSHRIATLSLTIVGIRTPRYSIARMLPDRRGPAGREDRNTWSHGRASSAALVPPRGFEPLISTLKGWRPGPLDDGGASAKGKLSRMGLEPITPGLKGRCSTIELSARRRGV